jgi:anti-sigma B factor antagonist
VRLLPSLDIAVHPHRSSVRVEACGEIDLSTCGALRGTLDELWESGSTDVVVDLRDVAFMDSTGSHILIDNQERATLGPASFSIIASAPVSRVLWLSGLQERLAVAA